MAKANFKLQSFDEMFKRTDKAEEEIEPILRQEMAKIVSRAMEFVLKEDIIHDTAVFTAKITDWTTTCTVCKPDIAQAYAKGIISGMPDGSFVNPSMRALQSTEICTRMTTQGAINYERYFICYFAHYPTIFRCLYGL